jgi:hypothetical protein
MLTKTNVIAINNSSIYFDISARGLLASAFVAYLLSCVIVRIYNRKLGCQELYTLIIENNNQRVTMSAMVDTGNKLHEPFSNSPVIIVDRSVGECLVGDSDIRIVPVSTVNNNSLLTAFKPERLILKTSKGQEVIENAYIALSDDIKQNGFSAILNCEILSV